MLPVSISSKKSNKQEENILQVLREHKNSIGLIIACMKGIRPSFYMHQIFLEDGHHPSV